MLERVPEKKALMVLNTSEMATAGDSGDTSVRPGVPRDVKRNADATGGLGSYSDPSRQSHAKYSQGRGHMCRVFETMQQ